jgi:hypothetical protein
MKESDLELVACTPSPLDPTGFNPGTEIPYGCSTKHILKAMRDFLDFLGFVNLQLHSKGIRRRHPLSILQSLAISVSRISPS